MKTPASERKKEEFLDLYPSFKTAGRKQPRNETDKKPTQPESPRIAQPNTQTEPQVEKPEAMIFAASGSAFAISADGYMVTNNHVIDGCQRVAIHDQGRKYEAIISASDKKK